MLSNPIESSGKVAMARYRFTLIRRLHNRNPPLKAVLSGVTYIVIELSRVKSTLPEKSENGKKFFSRETASDDHGLTTSASAKGV